MMNTDTNATMTEALQLTRAGQLTEAFALLKAGLAGTVTAPSDASTVAEPANGVAHFGTPLLNGSHGVLPEAPPAHAGPALNGVLDRLKAKLPDLPHLPDACPSFPRRGCPDPCRRPGLTQRRLPPLPVGSSATSPIPRPPGRAPTTSTSPPTTPATPYHSSSCSTEASRTPPTSRPARA
jgi:hypothetical protein